MEFEYMLKIGIMTLNIIAALVSFYMIFKAKISMKVVFAVLCILNLFSAFVEHYNIFGGN